MKVTLLNFEKYLYRSGIKYPQWFTMDVSFLTREEHFDKLSKNAVVVFIYIVGECVKARHPERELNIKRAALYCMMSENEVVQAIDILESVHVVRRLCAGHAQNMCIEGKGREGKGREEESSETKVSGPQPDLPDLDTEKLAYDFDHPSVNLPEAEKPMPKIILLWNQHAHELLPKVKLCSPGRRKHALNRWKENPSEEFWSDVIWKINKSDFCLGKTKSGWKASIDFLLRPDSAAKVLEGAYDNRGPGSAPPPLSFWAREGSKT